MTSEAKQTEILSSPAKPRRQKKILGVITRSDADDLLQALANLSDSGLNEGESVDKLLHGVLKRQASALSALFEFVPSDRDRHEVLWRFRYYLQQAWTADARARDWFILRAREVEARYRAAWDVSSEPDLSKRNVAIEKSLDELPAITPLEAAFVHLQEIQKAHKTRKCDNPECPVPYFIVRKKGQQRYCSTDCADTERRRAKRDWWIENRGKKGKHHAKRSNRQN